MLRLLDYWNEVRSLVSGPSVAGAWINVRYPSSPAKHKHYTKCHFCGIFSFMTNTNGNVLNFYCELPHHLGIEGIGSALLEIDLAIRGIAEPPIASVSTGFASGNSIERLEDEIEDYRRFYVDFEPHATEQDVSTAAGIIYSALSNLLRE